MSGERRVRGGIAPEGARGGVPRADGAVPGAAPLPSPESGVERALVARSRPSGRDGAKRSWFAAALLGWTVGGALAAEPSPETTPTVPTAARAPSVPPAAEDAPGPPAGSPVAPAGEETPPHAPGGPAEGSAPAGLPGDGDRPPPTAGEAAAPISGGAPIAAAGRLNPHEGSKAGTRCLACHSAPAPAGATPVEAKLRAPLSQPCGPCHLPGMHQGAEDHVGRAVPAGVELPALNGTIACFTCHDPHGPLGEARASSALSEEIRAWQRAANPDLPAEARFPGEGPTSRLRLPHDALCVTCHGDGP